MTRLAWVDATSGVSGDMLLGALHDLDAVDVAGLPQRLGVAAAVTPTVVRRGGLAARQVVVTPADPQPPRRLADILTIIEAADLHVVVKQRAGNVFHRLAEAEAEVHGRSPDEVHFHEVGGVDALIDIVGACEGLHRLGAAHLVVSTVSLGGGEAETSHGRIPVPGPAVLRLLRRSPLEVVGGPEAVELATPTGIAVLAEWATSAGPMPAMTIVGDGSGAGSRELARRPNLLRIVVGDAEPAARDWLVLEANVDDLDPRLWPVVLDRLLSAGAADAWLTPIVMKKGRPAHTVAALAAAEAAVAVRRCLLSETSTIGLRESFVRKHELDRSWVTVDVSGQAIRVKVARDATTVRNVSPEFDDVAAAAEVLGRPVKEVLAAASAAARALELSGSASGEMV